MFVLNLMLWTFLLTPARFQNSNVCTMHMRAGERDNAGNAEQYYLNYSLLRPLLVQGRSPGLVFVDRSCDAFVQHDNLTFRSFCIAHFVRRRSRSQRTRGRAEATMEDIMMTDADGGRNGSGYAHPSVDSSPPHTNADDRAQNNNIDQSALLPPPAPRKADVNGMSGAAAEAIIVNEGPPTKKARPSSKDEDDDVIDLSDETKEDAEMTSNDKPEPMNEGNGSNPGAAMDLVKLDETTDPEEPAAEIKSEPTSKDEPPKPRERAQASPHEPKSEEEKQQKIKASTPYDTADAKSDTVASAKKLSSNVSELQVVKPEIQAIFPQGASPTLSAPQISEAKAGESTKNSGVADAEENPPFDPLFASLVNLDLVPDSEALPKLSDEQLKELEGMLQFGDVANPGDSWKEDWSGNLQFVDKEIITNPLQVKADPMGTRPRYETFLEADAKRENYKPFSGVRLLFSYIYHMKVRILREIPFLLIVPVGQKTCVASSS
jgi:hypothetical protein